MFEKFIEEELGAKCPECFGDVTFWETEYGKNDDEMVDVLVCNDCGMTWERVYKYEHSTRIKG